MAPVFSPFASGNEPFVLRFSFLTDIHRSENGTEQRVANRSIPRVEVGYQGATLDAYNSGWMDALTYGAQATEFAIPYWPHGTYLTVAATAGSSVVLTVDTTNRVFVSGGFAVLWSHEGRSEEVTLSGTSGTTITAVTLANNWPVGTMVFPSVRGSFQGDWGYQRKTDGSIAALPVTFTCKAGTNPYLTVGDTLVSRWTDNLEGYANDAAFLAAWTQSSSGAGTGTATWTLDSTHTHSGTKAAKISLRGPVSVGDEFRITYPVTGLRPGTQYVYRRWLYPTGDTPPAGFSNGVYASFDTSGFTSDGAGTVNIYLRIRIVSGSGSVTFDWWYDDLELLEVIPLTLTPIRRDRVLPFERMVQRLESPTSTFQDFAVGSTPIGSRPIPLWLSSRSAINQTIAWFQSLKGRATAFWYPTYQQDLDVTAGKGTTSLTIKRSGYTTYLFPSFSRRHLAAIEPNGTITHLTVTNAVDNGLASGTETLTVSPAMPSGTTLCSYYLYGRLDSDTLEIRYKNNGFADCELGFVEAPAELAA